MEKKYYTIKETADMINISRQKLYQMIQQKEFPYLKIGSRILIPIDQLEKYLADNTVNTTLYKKNIY